jgi:hypothetical protein
MNQFTITWDILREGEFPKDRIEKLGIGVDIHAVKAGPGISTKKRITIYLKEPKATFEPEDIFALGQLVQSYTHKY